MLIPMRPDPSPDLGVEAMEEPTNVGSYRQVSQPSHRTVGLAEIGIQARYVGPPGRAYMPAVETPIAASPCTRSYLPAPRRPVQGWGPVGWPARKDFVLF